MLRDSRLTHSMFQASFTIPSRALFVVIFFSAYRYCDHSNLARTYHRHDCHHDTEPENPNITPGPPINDPRERSKKKQSTNRTNGPTGPHLKKPFGAQKGKLRLGMPSLRQRLAPREYQRVLLGQNAHQPSQVQYEPDSPGPATLCDR